MPVFRSTFMKALATALMLLAILCLAGGHWAILQTVAWAEMIRDYSIQEGSLRAGVEKTFSGKAPCEKCVKIQEGRQKEERRPATVKVEKKSENLFSTPFRWTVWLPPQPNVYPPFVCQSAPLRSDPPPGPVPISSPAPFATFI
ncbi:MAG: hypothetical protein B9S32_14530 [Verrucomicrobia bacterium Tous-C9LFEB]|nr:MAG: hypothetical protein B9S32_14530 [Verrucomicrobia bacterium Tous-C9LFEB]